MEIKQYAIKLPVDYRINLKKKYLETNENEDTAVQNIWDAAKAALTGKFITLQSFLKEQEKPPVNNPTSHLKQLEKEEQTKSKKLVERRRS